MKKIINNCNVCPVCGNDLAINTHLRSVKCRWCGARLNVNVQRTGNKLIIDLSVAEKPFKNK